MVKCQGLEAYLVREDMARVDEHGPDIGQRQFHRKGLFDGHVGQAVVYVETTGFERFNIIVRCSDRFYFGNCPDVEVRCLTNTGRLYLGYISKSSQNQIICLRHANSLLITPTDPKILAGLSNGICILYVRIQCNKLT